MEWHTPDVSISEAEVLAALSSILKSEEFRQNSLRARFLDFIVQESLAGRSNRIKGTVIAVEVYGRTADFDPQSDPIVRVEARKLRRDLEHYYLTAGVNDALRIDVPKGGYVPVITRASHNPTEEISPEPAVKQDGVERSQPDRFMVRLKKNALQRWVWVGAAMLGVFALMMLVALRGEQSPLAGRSPSGETGPTLLIQPFKDGSGSPEASNLARGLTIETTNALTKFSNLRVYPVGPSYPLNSENLHPEELAYVLNGEVQLSGGDLRITVQLQKAHDGLLVWSERFNGNFEPDHVFAFQDEIAERVTKQLAEPFGLLGDLSRREIVFRGNTSLYTYGCVLEGYEYRTTFSPEKHKSARDCLEKAVEVDGDYSRAWAVLAYLYVDEYRFFYNPQPKPYSRALEAARKAVELNPNDELSHQALSVALFGNGEIEAALEAGRQAVKLNPYNTEALIQIGYRTYATGRWEEGVSLVEKAIADSPVPPPWHPWVPALYHYQQQNYERARELAEAAGLPHLVLFEATRTAIYGQLGLNDKASKSLENVRQLDPQFDTRARQWFAVQQFPESFIDSIMEGLIKAGLKPVSDL